LAEEKLKDIVTASGRPSGIATTITVIAIMMVSSKSVHSLFSRVSEKSSSLHPTSS
jgi:hypothetical protein